jgi:hypothetical protein
MKTRFSLRTLAIVVMLISTYFAAWGVTKKVGVARLRKHGPGAAIRCPTPFLVAVHFRGEKVFYYVDGQQYSAPMPNEQMYFVWLFGLHIQTAA